MKNGLSSDTWFWFNLLELRISVKSVNMSRLKSDACPTVTALCLLCIFSLVSKFHYLCTPPYRLVGLVVKASASRAEGPGFESRLRRDFFGVESYQ